MKDQHRLVDFAQPIAEVVLLDRLVLADDSVQWHLAKMLGVVFDPLGMLGDEARIVEIRIAT